MLKHRVEDYGFPASFGRVVTLEGDAGNRILKS
jgi:hypothetical protein